MENFANNSPISRIDHESGEPSRSIVNNTPGAVLLEFGAGWCGHCQRLAPALAQELTRYPGVRHWKVEDGPGRPLGRSFGVRLWPTLVFLRDGRVRLQVARPDRAAIRRGLAAIADPPEPGPPPPQAGASR